MALSRLNAVLMSSCFLTFLSAVVVILAFTTPYWLVSDGLLASAHFQRLGLWEACFVSFFHPNYLYDKEFRGCMWILDEDYNFIHDILEKPFFIAVQVLYTLGFVVLLLACLLLFAFLFCIPAGVEMKVLMALSACMYVSGFFHMIAVIVFGALGDGRDWMPDPDNNSLSWSFGLAVVGSILQLIAAVLYMLESMITRRRMLKEQVQQSYALGEMPSKTNHQ